MNKWSKVREGGKIVYNAQSFVKDKEGCGEKSLLQAISKNNEKSKANRIANWANQAKRDGASSLLFVTKHE